MLLSSEILYWQGAFVVVIAGATLPFCTGLEWQSCRSRRTCANGQFGFPRNLGDPVVSSVNSRLELPGYQLQALAAVLVHRGAKRTSANRGIVKRRQRSAARWAAGSRSALIVPLKQGNSPWRTLWRGSEASSVRLNRGKHVEHIEVPLHVTVT